MHPNRVHYFHVVVDQIKRKNIFPSAWSRRRYIASIIKYIQIQANSNKKHYTHISISFNQQNSCCSLGKPINTSGEKTATRTDERRKKILAGRGKREEREAEGNSSKILTRSSLLLRILLLHLAMHGRGRARPDQLARARPGR